VGGKLLYLFLEIGTELIETLLAYLLALAFFLLLFFSAGREVSHFLIDLLDILGHRFIFGVYISGQISYLLLYL
jgi:hypothetical protein